MSATPCQRDPPTDLYGYPLQGMRVRGTLHRLRLGTANEIREKANGDAYAVIAAAKAQAEIGTLPVQAGRCPSHVRAISSFT